MALSILSIGTFRPGSQSVDDLIARAGGDVSKHTGWKQIGVANGDEHPSTMGMSALNAAMKEAGIGPADLRLVLSTGTTSDFPPSWSVANELMRLSKVQSTCVGFDIIQGCVSTLTALEIADSWLKSNGGGYAAIVCSQKWSYTIDRKDARSPSLWSWGDGAAVLIVTPENPKTKSRFVYHGSSFYSQSQLHGNVHRLHGGTRSPVAPAGQDPFALDIGTDIPVVTFFKIYEESFRQVISLAKAKFGAEPKWVVCNHVSPGIVDKIAALAGVDKDHSVHCGNEIGHVSASDIMFDLDKLSKRTDLKNGDKIFAVSSGQHTFACGYIEAKI